MKSMKVQWLSYNSSEGLSSSVIKSNSFDSVELLDSFDINIIDLAKSEMWKNTGDTYRKVNFSKDFVSLESLIKSTTSIVIIIYPKNFLFRTNYYAGKYLYSKHIKDILQDFYYVIEELNPYEDVFPRIKFGRVNQQLITNELFADFTFDEDSIKSNHFDWQTISKTQHEAITAIKHPNRNLYLTTLNIETENELQSLLKELNIVTVRRVDIPTWFEDVEPMFDEKILLDKMELSNKVIKEEQASIKDARESLETINGYKSILYSTGEELEIQVRGMLNEMIPSTIESHNEDFGADFLFEYDNYFFVGEIKGINKNVGRANISQVNLHRDKEIDDDNLILESNSKSLLIINTFRLKPLKDREPINLEMDKLAKKMNVLIITTEVLLKVFEKFKLKELVELEVFRMLRDSNGILEV